jgi:hypothetical protein
MNDLLLRMLVLRHATAVRQCGDHLIHRFAIRDRPPRDARTDLNGRIFSFHFQNPTPKKIEALAPEVYFLEMIFRCAKKIGERNFNGAALPYD